MTIKESFFRDILRLFIWFPFRWLILLGSVRWAFLLYKLAGDLHYFLGRGKKQRLSENMQKVLQVDPAVAQESAKRILENHYLDRLHIFLYPKLKTWADLAPYVQVENSEIFAAQLQRGKGVMLVQPHFGPVQITLLALALQGYQPLQIGNPSDRGLSFIGKNVAFRYRLKYEAMLPAPIIAADGYLGVVYKHLKGGGIVFSTGDGAGGGVFLGEHRAMPFLGVARMMPLGPATWAIRTGAVFLPTFIIPERWDRFRIVFDQPICPIYGDLEKDRVYLTEQFSKVADRYIRRYPYCWHFWDEII